MKIIIKKKWIWTTDSEWSIKETDSGKQQNNDDITPFNWIKSFSRTFTDFPFYFLHGISYLVSTVTSNRVSRFSHYICIIRIDKHLHIYVTYVVHDTPRLYMKCSKLSAFKKCSKSPAFCNSHKMGLKPFFKKRKPRPQIVSQSKRCQIAFLNLDYIAINCHVMGGVYWTPDDHSPHALSPGWA